MILNRAIKMRIYPDDDTRFLTWSVEIQNPVRADFQPLISDTRKISLSWLYSRKLVGKPD